MNKIKVGLITVIVVFLAALGFSANVYADDEPSSALVVSPMYQKIILVPGESTSMSIKITNPNIAKNNLEYSVKIGSFSQQGTSKDDDYVDTDTITAYNQIMNWIKLDKTTGTVEPNNTDTLTFTIDVPKSAPAGGQYATILIKDDTPKDNSSSGNVSVQSDVQMASIIYAEVAGETINTADITENNVPSLLMNNELKATSIVRNTGNVHTDAQYTLQVWPVFSDEEICTNEEKPDTNLIMPDMERYYVQTCNMPLVGIFRAKQVVKIFGETSIVEKMIIVCPLWLMFLVIFIIAALITWIVIRVKTHKKKAENSEKSA